jgi:hypothetical protein
VEKVRWQRTRRAQWGVTRPLLADPFWGRLKIVETTPELLVIVSHRLETTKTHFVDKRTVGCTQADGVPCWLDHEKVGSGRYEGWLAVFSPRLRAYKIISLTKRAVAQEPRLELADFDLRGRVLGVWRRTSGERAQMAAHLRDDPPNESGLEPAPDVRVLVERLWQAEDRLDAQARRRKGLDAQTCNAAANGLPR